MSTINTNIADYLRQIETLTNTNLQILKTLNDAFYTRKNHLFAEVDNTTYVIPSFISLENKINMLLIYLIEILHKVLVIFNINFNKVSNPDFC